MLVSYHDACMHIIEELYEGSTGLPEVPSMDECNNVCLDRSQPTAGIQLESFYHINLSLIAALGPTKSSSSLCVLET